MQKYPILAMGWVIRGAMEMLVTGDRLLQSDVIQREDRFAVGVLTTCKPGPRLVPKEHSVG